jgi:hypothetical protein
MPVSGIRGTHDIAFGSHLCLFYRRPREFLQVTASFLHAGLKNGEFCIWVLPPPITIPQALDALAHHHLNGVALQAAYQLQVVASEDWYSDGAFNVDTSLDQLAALPSIARELGYTSVRAVGGPGPFATETLRQAFMRYEHRATEVIAGQPFIGLCCYASPDCMETDMYDIMSAHPQALLWTASGWLCI